MPTVRVSAALALKNAITMHWEKREAFSAEERGEVRQHIVPVLVVQGDRAVIVALSTAVAHIFRHDYPDRW